MLRGSHIVTRSGVVLTHPVWLFRTCYRNPIVLFRALAVSFGSIMKRGVKAYPGEKSCGVVHSVWSAGYYHWLTESLPRALVMRSKFPDSTLVLPSEQYRCYEPSLRALGFNDISYFPDNANLRLVNPVITECPRQFGTTSPELLKKVRDEILSAVGKKEKSVGSRLIYASRDKARGRKVTNEKELVATLTRLGVECVCFEDFTFEAQVQLMQEAAVLISIHGAGLANMLFMPPGGKVVELLPRKNGIFDYNIVRNSLRHDPCYVRLAEAMGHQHIWLECESDRGRFEGTHMANIEVNINEFFQILKRF